MAFSRWITPAEVKIRFDTYFYLARDAGGPAGGVDGEEIVDHRWFTPRPRSSGPSAGEILLVFPTIKHLEQLAAFASVTALLAYARGRVVEPVQPRVVLDGASAGARSRASCCPASPATTERASRRPWTPPVRPGAAPAAGPR